MKLRVPNIKIPHIPRFVRNKYVLTLIFFVLWLVLFDRNSFIEKAENRRKLEQLEKEKEYYLQKISIDAERLRDVKSSKENLEKFARERYFMKKDNEDVFLIVEASDDEE